jgi:hypothetical protein
MIPHLKFFCNQLDKKENANRIRRMLPKDRAIDLTKKDADEIRKNALFQSLMDAEEAILEKIGSPYLVQFFHLNGASLVKLQSTSFNTNCDSGTQEGRHLNPEGENARWKTKFTNNYGKGWELKTTWGRRELAASCDSKEKIEVKAFLPVEDIVYILEEGGRKAGGCTRNGRKILTFLNDLRVACDSGKIDNKYYPIIFSSISGKSSITLPLD